MTTKDIATYIDIDGKEYPHFVSLVIRQAFYEHNEFELVLNQDALAAANVGIRATQDFIGRFAAIAFGELEAGDQFFRGVVTEASFHQTQGEWVQMTLKGFGTTYLMEGGEHSATYSNKTLKDLVEECTSNLADNDLNLENSPAFREEIPYKCQYRESSFRFLVRLAKEYGEWCYSNGRELYFGRPSSTPTAQLTQGRDLHKVQLSLRLVADKSVHSAYDHDGDEVLKSESPKEGGGDEFATASADRSGKLYRFAMQHSWGASKTKAALDGEAKQLKGRRAAGIVLLKGEGDNTKVRLGEKVEINFEQHDLSNELVKEKGEYLVISIEHRVSGTGGYTNSFEAISGKSDHIPYEWSKPRIEPQTALVKDNADPKGLGRVKVQMPWQKGRTTDWVWCLGPDAGSSADIGKNRGYVFIPEIGDRVMLGFEQNDPDRPFVMGSTFNGKTAAGGGKDNNIKSIITRSGHTILLDDTSGSERITISDKSGNEIKYDTKKKSLHITSTGDMELTAKNITITAEEKVEILAKKKIGLASEGDVEMIAKKELALQSDKDTTVKSGAGITLEATKDAILNGQNVTAEGKVKATIKGAQTKISGKMTALQGAAGKIELM